ncbi:MAG: hypothetical protein J5857_08705 [Treponema sp.]|nr:hypothetical protein [Treponema sp.]
MRINVMREDERFREISENRIILENARGEIRIVSLIMDEDGIRIDPEKEIIIGYGDGTVEIGDMDEDMEVTSF